MSFYDIKVNLINGKQTDLSVYRGKVLLVVNTASRCSYSSQFADLQKLYDHYSRYGLEILAFPCNQFNEKEPGDNSEVRAYCESHFRINFPLFEKVEVRGEHAHPLFQFLTLQAPFQGMDPHSVDGPKMANFLQKNILMYTRVTVSSGISLNS